VKPVYLDNNATTHLLPEVREAMSAFMSEAIGNPSSAHSHGEPARVYITQARDAVASLIGADSSSVVFTSGGTEANNTVLKAIAEAEKQGRRVITTQVEHSSVIRTCDYLEARGADVVRLSVDSKGAIDLDELREHLTPETALVSVQWVNNETGAVQPIEHIGEICRSAGVLFHTDAAQAVGKLSMDVGRMPVDFLTLTGHKFHAPAGVGGIYAREPHLLEPLLHGGSQEHGRRAGTENVVGIVGIGRAAELRCDRLAAVHDDMGSLRDAFQSKIQGILLGVHINGDPEHRICNTTNLRFEDADGQALVAQLDRESIFCSQSSACTSHRPEPSYVLRAMGLSEQEAYSSVRFSFSELSTIEEVGYAAEKIAGACERLRGFTAQLSSYAVDSKEAR